MTTLSKLARGQAATRLLGTMERGGSHESASSRWIRVEG